MENLCADMEDEINQLQQAKDNLAVTEANLRSAVDMANREHRKRTEAYAKLDILMREYRELAQRLAGALAWITGEPWQGDAIVTVTSAFLERLSLETSKLPAGDTSAATPQDSSTDTDPVDPRLVDGRAGGAE